MPITSLNHADVRGVDPDSACHGSLAHLQAASLTAQPSSDVSVLLVALVDIRGRRPSLSTKPDVHWI